MKTANHIAEPELTPEVSLKTEAPFSFPHHAMVKSTRLTVRRPNNDGGKDDSRRSSRSSSFHVLSMTLIVLVTVLSIMAIHLSQQIVMHKHYNFNNQQKIASSRTTSSVRQSNAITTWPKKKFEEEDNNSNRTDRVYCMIPFIWNEEMYTTIMETWGKRCDSVYFLTDSIVGSGKLKGDTIIEDGNEIEYKPYWEYPTNTFPNNVIFINMTRSWNDCYDEGGRRNRNKQKEANQPKTKKVCRHIWEKMWRSWVYVAEHHISKAEWYCKVDYDTFFFPQNLKYYVNNYKHWNPYTEYHYFGHLIQSRHDGPPMIAGAAVCWSHKTLTDIATVYRNMPMGYSGGFRGKCEDRAHATEEASTSICLHEQLNISAYPARDDTKREFIALDKYQSVLTWNRTEQGEWWYWKGKPATAGQMENTITSRPIGIHKYKATSEIRELEQHFYGHKDNKEIGKLKPYAREYVIKVRKAMGID